MTSPIISQYLSENAAYIGETSAAAISSLPDSAWSAVLEALEEMGGWKDPGIDCAVAITHDTLNDFDDARLHHWSERGSRSEFVFAGFKAVNYERFQLFRGQQRRSQMVIDIGDRRIALH